MKAGKPQDQSLAIAYAIKRKNARKKMASGGEVLSAKSESRPMPDQSFASESEKRRNLARKKLEKADWDSDASSEQVGRSFSKSPGEGEQANFKSGSMSGIDRARSKTNMAMERESSSDLLDIDRHHDEDIEDALLMADGGAIEDEHSQDPDMYQDMRNVSLEESNRMPDEEEEHFDSVSDAIMVKKRAAKLRKAYADGGEVDIASNAREYPNLEDDLSYDALRKENYSEEDSLRDQPRDSNLMGDEREDDAENEHDKPLVDQIRRHMRMRKR